MNNHNWGSCLDKIDLVKLMLRKILWKTKNEIGMENKLHLKTICDSVGNYMYLEAFPTQVAPP